MKLIYLAGILLVLNAVQGSWLSDVFTGLNEAVHDSKVKNKIEVLGSNIKKVHEDAVKKFKDETPNDDWIEMTKKYLEDIPFKVILEEKGDEKMASLVAKWNNVIQELNNVEKFKSTKEMYRKIRKDLRDLLPADRFKDWKKKTHNIVKKIKDVVKDQLKKTDIDVLKKSVKTWLQPSFMENKENLEEEKKMVRDVVIAANKKIKEEAAKAHKKIQPIIKLSETKKETDAAESRLESWLEKKFTKPHHPSGQSKWELLLKKMPLTQLKKKGATFKKAMKKFKKLAKMNKKFLIEKKPVETAVKMITGGDMELDKEEKEKLESMTLDERREYELAEAKWKAKMAKEAQKLIKKWSKKNKKEAKKETTTTVAPTPMLTGNEQWLDEEDDDNYDDDDIQLNFQQTKTKLQTKKKFDKDFKSEEDEWFALGKKIKSMLKHF